MANIDESKPAVLVTGAGGSIGAEVSLQLYESSEPFDLVINDISEPALLKFNKSCWREASMDLSDRFTHTWEISLILSSRR